MGGHGLYSTVGDYMLLIRMWLNDGAGEHGRVLKPETVQMAEKNHLGDKKVTMLPGVIPSLSNDAEFFPGLSKSWALTFMVNDAGHDSALSRCGRKSATGLQLLKFQAAVTASRHVLIAAARKVRCVEAEVRWRWTLKVLKTAA